MSRATDLPFQIDDAGRSEAEATATGLPVVNQDTALNFRYVYVSLLSSYNNVHILYHHHSILMRYSYHLFVMFVSFIYDVGSYIKKSTKFI